MRLVCVLYVCYSTPNLNPLYHIQTYRYHPNIVSRSDIDGQAVLVNSIITNDSNTLSDFIAPVVADVHPILRQLQDECQTHSHQHPTDSETSQTQAQSHSLFDPTMLSRHTRSIIESVTVEEMNEMNEGRALTDIPRSFDDVSRNDGLSSDINGTTDSGGSGNGHTGNTHTNASTAGGGRRGGSTTHSSSRNQSRHLPTTNNRTARAVGQIDRSIVPSIAVHYPTTPYYSPLSRDCVRICTVQRASVGADGDDSTGLGLENSDVDASVDRYIASGVQATPRIELDTAAVEEGVGSEGQPEVSLHASPTGSGSGLSREIEMELEVVEVTDEDRVRVGNGDVNSDSNTLSVSIGTSAATISESESESVSIIPNTNSAASNTASSSSSSSTDTDDTATITITASNHTSPGSSPNNTSISMLTGINNSLAGTGSSTPTTPDNPVRFQYSVVPGSAVGNSVSTSVGSSTSSSVGSAHTHIDDVIQFESDPEPEPEQPELLTLSNPTAIPISIPMADTLIPSPNHNPSHHMELVDL